MADWSDPWGLNKPARKQPTATEWKALKAISGGKCVVCGKTEKAASVLQKAHVKAHSKGGTVVIPMCPICHDKYDKGTLTNTQLKKLGLTPEQHHRLRPKTTGAAPKVVKAKKVASRKANTPAKKKKKSAAAWPTLFG